MKPSEPDYFGPTKFSSQHTYRDYMNVDDIEGARPTIMKGYGGSHKEYENASKMTISKINRLPFAGVASRAAVKKALNPDQKSGFSIRMSEEQNAAADYIDFMKHK
jgi:hypothetical protein